MSPALSLGFEHGPEKCSLEAEDAAGGFGVFVCSDAVWISLGVDAVLLVFGQGGEREQRVADVVGSLRWHEVAVVLAAEAVHQLDPQAAVALEVVQLCWVQYVPDLSSNSHVELS